MVYIALGSNLGNRINHLKLAKKLLKKRGLYNSQTSIVLETEAILPNKAPDTWNKPFLNMIISGQTDLTPDALLKILKEIETEIGRPLTYEKWAPRVIDLDIVLWDDLTIHTSDLIIPHPELNNRPFWQQLLSLMNVEPWKNLSIISSFKKSFVLYPSFVGVVNITSDSFSDGGQFNEPDRAIAQIKQLAEDGASVIEIGAQSTRPGAILQNPEEEYHKLIPVLEGISERVKEGSIEISIDSFWPSVIQRILQQYPISWVNDVKGDLDEHTLKMIAEKGCRFCCMHSLGIPPQANKILSHNQNPMDLLKAWGEISIDRLLKLGFSEQNIILDPGIGFGKSAYQNMDIIRYAHELKTLGVLTMIGHSRKSYIRSFSSEDAKNRDIETIAISLILKDKIDFLRVHNVRDHMRFFTAYESFYQHYEH